MSKIIEYHDFGAEAIVRYDKAMELIINSWLTRIMGAGNFDEKTVLAIKEHYLKRASVDLGEGR